MLRLSVRPNTHMKDKTRQMKDNNTQVAVRALSSAEVDAAATVAARAFATYPLMPYLFPGQSTTVRDFMYFCCARRLAPDGLLLGAFVGENEGENESASAQLVGMCAVSPPEMPALAGDMLSLWQRVETQMTQTGLARLDAYESISDQFAPPAPHHYLGVLAVEPTMQGRGISRKLIEAVRAQVQAHPTSNGIYLDTQTPENLPIYERLGFSLIGQQWLDEIGVWGLFWPK